MHGLFGIPVNIFSILALILSLGISMDFFIFFSHNAEIKGITFIAVFLFRSHLSFYWRSIISLCV